MPFDWGVYYLIAQHLGGLTGSDVAGWHRSAISRAYYAAFHKAEAEYAKVYGPAPGGRKHPHTDVWLWFKNHTEPGYRKVGFIGLNLMDDRHIADYDDDFPGLSDAVAHNLERAHQILIAFP